MKKIAKLLFASAALLTAFVSCQKVEEISEAPKTTHIVRFTTEMPTKTSYTVEGTTVNYKWEESDLYRLHVYEDGVEGTIDVDNSLINESYVMLTVNFEGTGAGSHTYTANLNGGVVKSEQVADGKYDSDCDVLVAKPVSSEEITDGIYTFQFRRPVAITELKLKDLKADEKVSKVTIISDSEHPIAGKYTQSSTDYSTGDWSDTSNKIVVTFGTEQDGTTPKTKTIGSDGVLPLSIVTRPIKEASVKVLVETESGLKYRKVTASALKLLADVVKAQGIGLTQVSEAEHTDAGWYLVTDASELFDGDEIRIACTSKNMMSGDLAVDENSKTLTYLTNCEVSFNEGKLTGVTPGSEPQIFTLAEGYDKWNITTTNGKLGATAVKTLKYDDGTLDWGIGIGDEGVATISSATDAYGAIKYNASSPRFLNYASGQTDIQIFKKYGDAVDPVIKTARTASFSAESATVTIDANNNVFPGLSFEPTEATEGTQTWTSSNTEVATINETTGEVTLVSDGTTTIKVEIAETDTYQPCSAEYVLTVNPAAVAGEDYLDWAFTNVTSYTDWTNTGSASGNTYAGQSTKFKSDDKNNSDKIDAIQMRTTNSNSGIVVKESPNDKVARKITVGWNSYTNEKSLDIYGKSTAYSSAANLYSSEAATQGTYLGSIVEGTSTELTISGDYEFIGIRSKDGALYLNWIKIQWEDAKPEYNACFKNGDVAVEEVNGTVGVDFTAPTLSIDGGLTPTVAYESSNKDVATVDAASGAVTLKKKGDATITATLNGDETHKTTTASYTIHVSNELSSIKLADDSEQPTTFYVGQNFSFAGIKLEAEYNDGEKKTLTAYDLTADNFSGFDSSAAVEKQTITVSYTDGATQTTPYDIEIKPLVTLYGITVPAEDANGNSITVKGGLTEAPEGAEIELNVNLNTDKGYKLTSLKVNEAEHSSDVAGGKYTFTMPAEAVTVTAEFDNHYTVTLTQPAANGTVKVQNATTSSQSIACGETVSVLAKPETGYELDSWTINGAELADATKASTTFTMPANDVSVTASFKVQVASVHDILTNADFAATSTQYKEFSNVKKNTAVYAGNSAKNNGIQLRTTNSNSGIVSTTSGGCIKSVTVTWNANCFEGRTLDVYGKNSAYSTAADLYNNTNQGTKIGSIVQGQSTSLTITGDYTYVGVRSNSGALNIDNIDFEWGEGGTPTPPTPTSYNINLTQPDGGSIEAKVGDASVSSAEAGKTVSLVVTSTPSGKAFSSWTVTKAGGGTVAVSNNQFEMPEDNVTVEATFTTSGGGTTPTKGTVLWGENFAHFGTNTPSAAGTGTGTTIYDNANITYAQDDTGTKGYNEKLAGGTAPELLLKSGKTWTISNIKTGGATSLSLTYKSNNTKSSVTCSTSGVEVKGSAKSYSITVPSSTTSITLVFNCTGNTRIDDVELKVN